MPATLRQRTRSAKSTSTPYKRAPKEPAMQPPSYEFVRKNKLPYVMDQLEEFVRLRQNKGFCFEEFNQYLISLGEINPSVWSKEPRRQWKERVFAIGVETFRYVVLKRENQSEPLWLDDIWVEKQASLQISKAPRDATFESKTSLARRGMQEAGWRVYENDGNGERSKKNKGGKKLDTWRLFWALSVEKRNRKPSPPSEFPQCHLDYPSTPFEPFDLPTTVTSPHVPRARSGKPKNMKGYAYVPIAESPVERDFENVQPEKRKRKAQSTPVVIITTNKRQKRPKPASPVPEIEPAPIVLPPSPKDYESDADGEYELDPDCSMQIEQPEFPALDAIVRRAYGSPRDYLMFRVFSEHYMYIDVGAVDPRTKNFEALFKSYVDGAGNLYLITSLIRNSHPDLKAVLQEILTWHPDKCRDESLSKRFSGAHKAVLFAIQRLSEDGNGKLGKNWEQFLDMVYNLQLGYATREQFVKYLIRNFSARSISKRR